jgi:predicted MFS family arabinose efflux permease
MQRLHASSSFSALANVPFRRLWFASLASGTAVAADQTAARWTLNHLSGSAFVISLLSTMAALPFLVFTLPAGFLADAVDRRPLLRAINVWQALVAATLALQGFLGVLTPVALLGGSLAFGVGFAFNSPVWTALLPDVVSERDLPSTATLGALQMNLSGIVGPALGGFLLSLSSPPFVFGLNALGFLGIVLALRAEHPKSLTKHRPEAGDLRRSLADAFHYVRTSVAVRAVLARNFLFALFVSAIPALMPVIALKDLRLDPAMLGLLFTSMGTGSVLGSLVLHGWARRYFSANHLTLAGSALLAAIYLWMALIHHNPFCLLVAGVAGAAWTLSASELWLAAQRAIAPWARGRVNAAVIMLSQGAMAVGGIVWGAAAEWFGTRISLLAITVLFMASLMVARRWSLDLLDIPGPSAG